MLFEGLSKKPPSLVDLCIRTAISNVRYIGYVGGVDFQLLEQILGHCTEEQLMHIEDSTQDTDLSPVTNKFWKKFYELRFGAEELDFAMEQMRREKVNVKWRVLHEAKLVLVQEEMEEAAKRLKQLYKKEDARKQSRQIKICSKAPPSKRPFWGSGYSGYNVSNVKSNIMKKAKLELLNSQEVKNLTAIKRNAIQKSFSIPAPKRTGLSANAPSTSRSIPYGGGNLTAIKRNTFQKSFSISAPKRTCLSANVPSTSRSIPSGERNLPPKRINSLPGAASSTSRSIPSGERNLPPKRITSLPGAASSTSRSIPSGERNLPPKRINSLPGAASSTSRSIPSGERNLPPKRIKSLPETAPTTSKNAATRQKNM